MTGESSDVRQRRRIGDGPADSERTGYGFRELPAQLEKHLLGRRCDLSPASSPTIDWSSLFSHGRRVVVVGLRRRAIRTRCRTGANGEGPAPMREMYERVASHCFYDTWNRLVGP